MPLYTKIGGKLIEIKSLNTTTGGILKPIYGTPKDNVTLYWGGFTGDSCTIVSSGNSYDFKFQPFLIGKFDITCPTYVNFSCNANDTMTDGYKNVTNVTNALLKDNLTGYSSIEHRFYYNVWLKTTKSVTADSEHSWSILKTRKFSKDNDVSKMTENSITDNEVLNSTLKSLDEGTYYVYATKASFFRPRLGVYSVVDFSGMEMNINFKFQTLNGG